MYIHVEHVTWHVAIYDVSFFGLKGHCPYAATGSISLLRTSSSRMKRRSSPPRLSGNSSRSRFWVIRVCAKVFP